MKQIQAVIFDWAGTLVDFGSRAPGQSFLEAFYSSYQFQLNLEEVRTVVGLSKRESIVAITELPAVALRWKAQFGEFTNQDQVETIYQHYLRIQLQHIETYSNPIPGASTVLQMLKKRGIKIGSCTGYPRCVMDKLIEHAKLNGISPDCVVASDDLTAGARPAPFMLLKNVIDLEVTDVRACIKVDDSIPGIEEGLNAGMWTVALLMSGNETGLSWEQYRKTNNSELAMYRDRAQQKFYNSGAHYQIDTIADLPNVISHINHQMAGGRRP